MKVPVRRKEEKKKDNNNQPFCVNCAHAAFLLEEINRQRSHSELSLFISLLSFFSFFPCFSLFIFFFLFSVSPEQQRKQCTSHFRKRSIKQNDLMPVGAVGAGHAVHRLRSQLHLFSAVPPRVWPCGAQDNLHRVLLVRGYKPSHRRWTSRHARIHPWRKGHERSLFLSARVLALVVAGSALGGVSTVVLSCWTCAGYRPRLGSAVGSLSFFFLFVLLCRCVSVGGTLHHVELRGCARWTPRWWCLITERGGGEGFKLKEGFALIVAATGGFLFLSFAVCISNCASRPSPKYRPSQATIPQWLAFFFLGEVRRANVWKEEEKKRGKEVLRTVSLRLLFMEPTHRLPNPRFFF